MSTEAPARTHCPNCNAKLHRQDLSLCAYCATPLSIGGRAVADDETIQRLKRMREHKGFPAAIEFRPFDPGVLARMNRANAWAWALGFVGLVALVLRLILARGAFSPADPYLAAPLALVGVSLFLFARAASLRRRELSLPLVRRPAIVVDRRSVTSSRGAGAATTYHFTMRFDDGSEGEFAWPGQGTSYEPLVNGTTGVAYTRGQTLIEFRRL